MENLLRIARSVSRKQRTDVLAATRHLCFADAAADAATLLHWRGRLLYCDDLLLEWLEANSLEELQSWVWKRQMESDGQAVLRHYITQNTGVLRVVVPTLKTGRELLLEVHPRNLGTNGQTIRVAVVKRIE